MHIHFWLISTTLDRSPRAAYPWRQPSRNGILPKGRSSLAAHDGLPHVVDKEIRPCMSSTKFFKYCYGLNYGFLHVSWDPGQPSMQPGVMRWGDGSSPLASSCFTSWESRQRAMLCSYRSNCGMRPSTVKATHMMLWWS